MKATEAGAPSSVATGPMSLKTPPAVLKKITAAPKSQTVAVSKSVSNEPRHLWCTHEPINLVMSTGKAPIVAIASAAQLSM
eukprot:CAMPEP_0115685374 /NCGR_PEP_ID=MMETSP0272-20121206/59421_1 /TAXON_ID=71861 /ORGANISM="Scrippsiella trochoidea, Strain CCMP3099" /LENGTH=80 /DNA_ID=CAMNT_0003124947 /DNA_START=352 /DNA_END=594 /DNA_ORIENTATION=-